MEILSDLKLSPALDQTGANLRLCYEKLVEAEIIPQQELHSIDLWLQDIASFTSNISAISR